MVAHPPGWSARGFLSLTHTALSALDPANAGGQTVRVLSQPVPFNLDDTRLKTPSPEFSDTQCRGLRFVMRMPFRRERPPRPRRCAVA